MTKTWNIDKGVPIPKKRVGGTYARTPETPGLYKLAETMEIGDSIGGLTMEQSANLQTYYTALVNRPRIRKFTRRIEEPGLYRIWRIS